MASPDGDGKPGETCPTTWRPKARYIPCSVEFVTVMLLALTPTAVPTLVTLPPETLVQCPPVLPVMVVSTIVRTPFMSSLVKNRPPPKAFLPAALLRTASPQRVMLNELPSP